MKTYVVTIIKNVHFNVEGYMSVPHEYEFESQVMAWTLYHQAKNQGYHAMITVRGEPYDLALRKEFQHAVRITMGIKSNVAESFNVLAEWRSVELFNQSS